MHIDIIICVCIYIYMYMYVLYNTTTIPTVLVNEVMQDVYLQEGPCEFAFLRIDVAGYLTADHDKRPGLPFGGLGLRSL